MHNGLTDTSPTALATFLGGHAPFDALDDERLRTAAQAAVVQTYGPGELIVDAFLEPTRELFVVLAGEVELWGSTTADPAPRGPDERLAPGGVFGYSAMLTQRSVGPRAVSAGASTVARIPSGSVSNAFATRSGVRFLAEHLSTSARTPTTGASYRTVEELVVRAPILVAPATPAREVAALMSEQQAPYAAVELGSGEYGLITNTVLRDRLIVGDAPADTSVARLVDRPAITAQVGESAAEALITVLDRDIEFLLVVDGSARLVGAVTAADFAVSPSAGGVALRQQLTRARDVDDLVRRAQGMPAMLGGLLSDGLATSRVISVFSSTIDALVRRALTLTFAAHPELDADAFTWLSLGSNGRREAVPSSDIDSAVAFDAVVGQDDQARFRAVFAEVNAVLGRAGVTTDEHGASAVRPQFARTNAQWRAAAHDWLADPVADQGAIMTSLLVDGRPIHGDPGLPAVARVFAEVRQHPGTMRLLLEESLSARARLRSLRDVLGGRGGTFDVKTHALVPVINIARWAALSVGAADLSTTDRLRAAAGSTMLTDDQAGTLADVFDVLQRIRLRYQLIQRERGRQPSDVLTMAALSPIDRSVIAQAVREISAVQKRMANIAQYVSVHEWAAPAS